MEQTYMNNDNVSYPEGCNSIRNNKRELNTSLRFTDRCLPLTIQEII